MLNPPGGTVPKPPMTLLERLDAVVEFARYDFVRELSRDAAAEIRRLAEEMDRQIAIRDEKITKLEIKVDELLSLWR